MSVYLQCSKEEAGQLLVLRNHTPFLIVPSLIIMREVTRCYNQSCPVVSNVEIGTVSAALSRGEENVLPDRE